MTQDQKVIRNKLGLLKLAQTLGSLDSTIKCNTHGLTGDCLGTKVQPPER